ncbi:MAG: vWA domain-containing protein [Saccharofermentanales bacterium]|jgi:Ca-activated chloride channel family protein|nr:VWA domain-containing protein [Bacillota bacterium]
MVKGAKRKQINAMGELKMKKLSTIALILAIILTLVSCGQSVMEIKNTTARPAGQTKTDNQATKAERTIGEEEVGLVNEPDMIPALDMPYYPEPQWNTEEYQDFTENRIINTQEQRFSTFAADVDTASYANVRRQILNDRMWPYLDSVRVEEMVNYFTYDYAYPTGTDPVAITTEMIDTPWNKNSKLLLVGLKARELDNSGRKPSNLVFLIDVSGSMDSPDKLQLVKRSFHLLTENLTAEDRISIVIYASSDQIICNGVSGKNKAEIIRYIEDLEAGGATFASQGISTAYQLAQENFIPEGNNRIILATDGDFNIGVTSDGDLKRMVEENRKRGISVTTLGFGSGNLKDSKLEILADHGNGSYHYIDSILEARKVLVEEIGSTLEIVAKDVKLQLEFNPQQVIGYRQIGYETRQLNREDFADDTKDGGEMGAGHTVTALYELYLPGAEEFVPKVDPGRYGQTDTDADSASAPHADELLTVNVRYKDPAGETSRLISTPVTESVFSDRPSDNMRLAYSVAAFAGILRQSQYFGTYKPNDVVAELSQLDTKDGRISELLQLVEAVQDLDPNTLPDEE